MKRILLLIAILSLSSSFLCTPVGAVPYLQLDVSDGIYDSHSETIVATQKQFTLYALMTPGGDLSNQNATNNADFTNYFYISMALMPKVGPVGVDLGSIMFDGNTINATSSMTYGSAPMSDLQAGFDAGDLSKHGIFETYFFESSFTFSGVDTVGTYNTAENPAGFGDYAGGTGSYYKAFIVDISGLADGYSIHFDLYNKSEGKTTGDWDVNEFAPFSHDVSAVPEPATTLLFGSGLIGLAVFGRKRFFRSA